MGDAAEFINRSDSRFRESQIAEWLWGYDDVVTPQIERLQQLLAPIKDKCLWLIRGNHEDSIVHKFQRDVYYEVGKAMGASAENPIMLGYQGFAVLRMVRRSPGGAGSTYTYTIYAHHGYGEGRLAGGKALKLERLPKNYQANLCLYGHQHSKIVNEPVPRVRPGKNNTIVEELTYTCMTGSYLQSYDKKGKKEVYSEAKAYQPVAVGSIRVRVHPDTQQVEVVS
jgi:hypothetical protein